MAHNKPIDSPALNTGSSFYTGMVLAMPFSEGTGTPQDYSPTPVTVTASGSPTWQTGPFGQEMNFVAASSQYLDLGNPAKLQFSTEMCLCFSYKITTVPAINKEYQFITKDDGVSNRAFSCDVAQ